MTIVDRIRSLCVSQGMTLTRLETELEIGRGIIKRWEKSSPNMDNIQKVANYFHVTTDYLLGRETNIREQVVTFQRAANEGMSDEELEDILNYARFRYPDRFK